MSQRKKVTTAISAIILIALAIGNWLADGGPSDAAPPPVAGAAGGATAVAKEKDRIRVSDINSLREHLAEDVTVYGRVRRTAKAGSGHHFLNFHDTELSVICMAADVAKFEKGGPAELFDGKDVEVSGRLEKYRGKLQIRVLRPEQVRVIDTQQASANATVELRQTGTNEWISPAGLVYRGFDPGGLNRVQHIERHTRDMPNRDGPHGVFDGGKNAAFAVIDEAWKRAEKQRLKPRVEGDRSIYDVSLGRRIGFLGGQTGARRRHPPLSRIRIVFESKTKNIVTAFPR